MPRRKRKKSRRKPAFSVLNALEAYVYATILTEGTAGTSPWGFVTGDADIGMTQALGVGRPFTGENTMQLSGAGEISIGDIVKNPSLSLETMAANFQANLIPMAVAGFTTSISFRLGKKLLRRPINNINRNIIRPALGHGIKL